MWVQCAQNAIIENRDKSEYHKRHLLKLKSITPTVRADMRPWTPQHSLQKWTNRYQITRSNDIFRHNQILLEKMMSIERHPSRLSARVLQRQPGSNRDLYQSKTPKAGVGISTQSNAFSNGTSDLRMSRTSSQQQQHQQSYKKKRALLEIQTQNEKMYERLQKSASYYGRQKWMREAFMSDAYYQNLQKKTVAQVDYAFSALENVYTDVSTPSHAPQRVTLSREVPKRVRSYRAVKAQPSIDTNSLTERLSFMRTSTGNAPSTSTRVMTLED